MLEFELLAVLSVQVGQQAEHGDIVLALVEVLVNRSLGVSKGDLRCLLEIHLARISIHRKIADRVRKFDIIKLNQVPLLVALRSLKVVMALKQVSTV